MLRSLRMWMRTSPGGYDTGLAGSFCVSVSATCSCHSAVNSSDFIYISQRPWNRKGAARKRSQGPRWIKRFYLLRKLVAYPDRAPIFLAASHPRCSIPISFRIVCVCFASLADLIHLLSLLRVYCLPLVVGFLWLKLKLHFRGGWYYVPMCAKAYILGHPPLKNQVQLRDCVLFVNLNFIWKYCLEEVSYCFLHTWELSEERSIFTSSCSNRLLKTVFV